MRSLIPLAWLACGTAPTPLGLRAVAPSSVTASGKATVRIEGQGFAPRIDVDLDDPALTHETTTFSAMLLGTGGSYSLSDVTFASSTELTARAPANLVPGTYALQVNTPSGEVTTLAGALEVRR